MGTILFIIIQKGDVISHPEEKKLNIQWSTWHMMQERLRIDSRLFPEHLQH